jgi:hypothetical protein
MAFVSKFILLLIISQGLWADSMLPILFTKQPLRNVRYISKDGVFTYFQNGTGQLLLSRNYQAKEVLKGLPGSNYLMTSTKSRKYILFTVDEHYHGFYGIREPLKIYKIRYGKFIADQIGLGQNPQLHLDDTWATFYNFQERVLYFQSLITKAIRFKIQLNNITNPYFNPHVAMIDRETVLFSDINDDGIPGILIFSRGEKKSRAIFKGDNVREKVELCLQDGNLIIGSFGLDKSNKGSKILSMPVKGLKFTEKTELYRSKLNDIGNMVCNFEKDGIYFVKNLSENIKAQFEATRLDLLTKETKILSDVGYANQIVPMDDKLLLPFRGKVFVLKGLAKYKSDALAEKKDKK